MVKLTKLILPAAATDQHITSARPLHANYLQPVRKRLPWLVA